MREGLTRRPPLPLWLLSPAMTSLVRDCRMAGNEGPECPRLNSRQVRAAAIIQNIVRYYARGSPTANRANDRGFPAQCDSTDPDISADHESASPSAAMPAIPSVKLPPDSAALPHDPTLTAFAQLAAFRLDCERGCISLIDHQHQYILAEGTRSVSLHNPEQCRPGDELWVGATKLDAGFGLCPDTIHVFDSDNEKLNVSSDNLTANLRCYVINDISVIDCFKDRPYVSGWPFIRFYAEVPLKLDGYVVGSVCVVDSKPGSGLDLAALDRLAEVASVVASHLSLVQSQTQLRRSQEMVRGLGRFVDGKSVRDWWKDTFNNQFKTLSGKESPSGQEQGFAQTLSTSSEHRYTASLSPQEQDDSLVALRNDPDEVYQDRYDSLLVTAANSPRSHTNDGLPVRPPEITLQVPGQLTPSEGDSVRLSVGTPPSEDAVQREYVTFKALQHLFSRASDLIRESSQLDGIIFVDASLQDIAVTHGRRKSIITPANTPRFGGLDSNVGLSISTKRNSSVATASTNFPAFIRQGFKARVEAPVSGGNQPICHLLGYSLQRTDGRGGVAPSNRHLEVPQSTLRGLLRRYPNGHVFLFNSDGSLLDDEETEIITHSKRTNREQSASKGKSTFEKEKEQLRAYQLLDICPGARGIIFFPLWDPQRDQWFAGSLAWTRDPVRILQSEDMTFLAAFGSCIMAEKSKMDALTADRAKSDFISSVSHELRSPLHGMLATMEVLADTTTNMEQDDLIRTVSTCGEVLLDTMDHILDYAKLSNSTKVRKLMVGGEQEQDSSHSIVKITSFDLSNLVECVVEGIFAGHNYRSLVTADKSSSEQAHRFHQEKVVRLTPPSMNPNVMVIVDIERQLNWLFNSQIGAWKRILTNLFGNALKYTEAGFIQVILSALPMESRPNSLLVTLEIQDSGIGMTQDYVKHRLYTPFAQENPMSAGTGLGLSIVRQLVNDLDGKIDIDSEVGYGTLVKISVPTNLSSSDRPDEQSVGSSATIRDIRIWCIGLKICLVGFDYYPEIEEAPTGILSVHARRMLAIRSSLSTLAAEWFGMEVVAAASLEDANGDFLLGIQSQLNLNAKITKIEPLIVFEDNYSGFRAENGDGVFHLSQPVGPHKLARILGLCLEYKSSATGSSDSPMTPLLRAASYGFSPSADLSQETEQDVQRHVGQSNELREQSQLDIPTRAETTTRELSNTTTSPLTTPLLIKPRSIVLLVEDNSVNMKILVNHMKRAKEDYTCAINGLEALHKYQAEPRSIKIIFMDIAMPVKDGIAATKEIRKFESDSKLPRVRIVALTCFSSEEYQKNAFRAGVDLFIIKPVPMKGLKPILEMDPDVVVPP